MKSIRLARILAVSVAVFAVSGTAVQAEVWRDVVRGMNLFDYNFNGQRNYLGNGWDLSATAVYTGQQYDFGFAELSLGSGVSRFDMGYTLRGIPKAEFSWTTGGAALPYTLSFNNGIQDFQTVSGSILIDVNTEVNVLGFYDTQIQISNRGTYGTDGFLADQEGDLAFDVGPIDVSGNIFADALAVVTQPLWAAANTPNPFTKFSQTATKTAQATATIEELRARIEAGDILTDEEMAQLVNSTLIAAILKGDAVDSDLFKSLSFPTKESASPLRIAEIVPEPTTVLLVLGLGTLALPRRRRSA